MVEIINDNVITKEIIDEILRKEENGLRLKKHEHIWFDNLKGVRKADLKYAMTDEEFEEYVKCKSSIHYFAQKYCKIKREDGSVGSIKLREYQKTIINLYSENRYSLLAASRQLGKCCLLTEIKIKNNNVETTTILDLLYYELLKSIRTLTIYEKIKYKLYQLLYKIKKLS